jgi:hypothetical protein
MSNGGFAKVTMKTAAEVSKQFELGEEASALLRPDLTPRQYLDLLLDKKLLIDAARFLAYAMPKRETVWWAYQCARQVSGPTPSPKAAAALAATQKWIAEPSDENRWAAKAAAERVGKEHPAGLAALSVFWASGSITPAGEHPVPAPEHLTALMAAGAIMLAAVFSDKQPWGEWYKQFFALGYDVANGKNVWK